MASQIAAGEVIERPASVVRELIDNSIDAGSDRIIIKIGNGGKGLIKVSDNGVGMGRDDLLLCLERHATSKITSLSDLFSIKSLGFRGEALPSISSVSRMEITSRPADQLVGYRLKVAGGKLKSIDETGSPAGTITEIRDLFFNVPARRKFLRTRKTETDHIIDILTRIAIPFTHIQFRLDDAERILLNLPVSENIVNRFSAIMGRKVAASMIDVYQETGELKVRAYLAPPDFNRNRGDRVFIYVNNRNIRDRLVTRAIIEGYGQRLMKGRYPQAVVFIDLDPNLLDINVHPTKQEIRFHQGQLVYKTIVSTIERNLAQSSNSIFDAGYPIEENAKERHINGMVLREPERVYAGGAQERAFRPDTSLKEEYLIKEVPRIIGQLKDTYILCQAKEGLLMIDQHAAHERIVYETLKKSYASSKIELQSFLIPQKIELSLEEGRILLKKLDQLVRMGFEIEHFGGSTFLVRAIPAILVNVKWEEFLLDLIPVLKAEGDLSNEKAMDRLLTITACHGAIRAGHRMSQEEMALLLRQLEEAELSTNCPHGRPVFKKFNYYEIEKMFKRVV